MNVHQVELVTPHDDTLNTRFTLYVRPTTRNTEERWPVIKTGRGLYQALEQATTPGDPLGPIELVEAITNLRRQYNPRTIEFITA